jgi:hypothetical protein
VDDYVELFNDVERRRAFDSPIPVFASDNWAPFEKWLLNVYGFLETPPYGGISLERLFRRFKVFKIQASVGSIVIPIPELLNEEKANRWR